MSIVFHNQVFFKSILFHELRVESLSDVPLLLAGLVDFDCFLILIMKRHLYRMFDRGMSVVTMARRGHVLTTGTFKYHKLIIRVILNVE